MFSFREELAAVRILDPACGSGNFLYVALERLLELDKEVTGYGVANGLSGMLPVITTDQLLGLEINEYARELAQVVIWIGYLQWMIRNGHGFPDPVLSPLETIRLQDALLDRTDPEHPKEAEWPEADYIIGNPPFVGIRRLRDSAGDEYVDDLWAAYNGRIPRSADLVGYFFEKARAEIESGHAKRAGLLATQSIRKGTNRHVLDRIKETGDIFVAWDDEPWILDGAQVRISIVGFDSGYETSRELDGSPVESINSDLTAGLNLTTAQSLAENQGLCFQGTIKVGPFEITQDLARSWLRAPLNPNGRPNSDVVRPWLNASDLTGRSRGLWIIDFGSEMTVEEASLYEAPFEYIKQHVFPDRQDNRDARFRSHWWLHGRPRPEMRHAMTGQRRYLCTPRVAKHRIFAWVSADVLPDTRVYVFAREDDYFFGILHSCAHEVWSLHQSSRHGVGNDPTYNNTTCFETFPLPWPPGQEPTADPRVQAIATAAKELDRLRSNWLNPPDCPEAELKKRTLTNLYNQKPAWLQLAHEKLDRAVWHAYGWDDNPTETTEDEILTRLPPLKPESNARRLTDGAEQACAHESDFQKECLRIDVVPGGPPGSESGKPGEPPGTTCTGLLGYPLALAPRGTIECTSNVGSAYIKTPRENPVSSRCPRHGRRVSVPVTGGGMSFITRWVRRKWSRFDLWRLQTWYRQGYRDGLAGRRGAEGRALGGRHRIAYLTGWGDGWADAGRPLDAMPKQPRRPPGQPDSDT